MSGEGGGGLAAVPDKGRARIEEAVAELRTARGYLLGASDPRGTGAYLEAMRSCMTDIAQTAQDHADASLPLRAAGPGGNPAAGSDVLAACGQALAAVDQLLLGIRAARRAALRSGRERETLAAVRDTLRLLLADRTAVDASSRELLRATARYLQHPPAATAAPGGREPARPADDGTTGPKKEE